MILKKKKTTKRTESSEPDSYIYCHMICNDTTMQWTKNGHIYFFLIEFIFKRTPGWLNR